MPNRTRCRRSHRTAGLHGTHEPQTRLAANRGTLDDFLEGFKRVPDEESQPAPVPYPKEEESTPVEIPKIPKTRKPYTTSKKVQVLFESGWETYKSVAEAAKALEVNYKTLYHNLTIGKPCKKHQVRYADDPNDKTETTNEEQPELP